MSLIGQIRFILEMQSYEKKLRCERWGLSVFTTKKSWLRIFFNQDNVPFLYKTTLNTQYNSHIQTNLHNQNI